ncbi:MAG TPA: F0F1 ATP synthase subunit B [Egibacteraceae bacterium]|nr:F0F1 ATP synthase subunit B [Egibacteraceae bacterium]
MQLLAAAQILLATEAGEAPAGYEVILPAWAELVWGAVGFAILFWILNKVAFPKMNEMLAARADKIQGQIEAAEAARSEAELVRRRYEEQLADARGEANRIVEAAKEQAERLRADLVAKAEEDAAQIRARASEDIDAERTRLVQELRSQVAVLSVELAGKIVHRELDAEQHRELVDTYIDELARMS